MVTVTRSFTCLQGNIEVHCRAMYVSSLLQLQSHSSFQDCVSVCLSTCQGGASIDQLDSTFHKRLNASLSTFSVAQLALLVREKGGAALCGVCPVCVCRCTGRISHLPVHDAINVHAII